jgi:type I restriction enzyme M protein
MILHGIEAPNILHTNTLAENLMDVQEKDRVDIILANPPFGSSTEQAEIQQNFPIRSGETAYMFLQHFIKMLKIGGKCGVVIKNTFLSNTDNASVALRKQLLEDCNLHTILDLPKGAFIGTGVSTVVLFFEKGKTTKDIWYYQLNLERNLGKTNSLNEKDLKEFTELFKKQGEGNNSWLVKIKDINKETYDLGANNPNRKEEVDNRTPEQILAEIEKLDIEVLKAIQSIKELL